MKYNIFNDKWKEQKKIVSMHEDHGTSCEWDEQIVLLHAKGPPSYPMLRRSLPGKYAKHRAPA